MQFINKILTVSLFFIIVLSLTSCEEIETTQWVDHYALLKVDYGYAVGNYSYKDENATLNLFIPSKIDDKNIIQLGFDSGLGFGGNGYLQSYNLKRLYCPNSIENINLGYLKYKSGVKVFYLGKITDLVHLNVDENDIYVLDKYYDAFYNLLSWKPEKDFLFSANVIYCLDAEEKNYYYIDYYDANSLIEVIPPDPTLEGKEFDGWYKEKECINKWDFETDTIYQIDENFVETILYAKWK